MSTPRRNSQGTRRARARASLRVLECLRGAEAIRTRAQALLLCHSWTRTEVCGGQCAVQGEGTRCNGTPFLAARLSCPEFASAVAAAEISMYCVIMSIGCSRKSFAAKLASLAIGKKLIPEQARNAQMETQRDRLLRCVALKWTGLCGGRSQAHPVGFRRRPC